MSKMLRTISLVFVVIFLGTIQSRDIRKQDSEAEFQRKLRRSDQYETVTSESDDYERLRFRFWELKKNTRESIRFKLHSVDWNVISRNVPVWTVESDNTALLHSYQKLKPETTKIDGAFYEDLEKDALLLGYYKNGYIFYDGVLGEGKSTRIIRSEKESRWWRGSEYVSDSSDEFSSAHQTVFRIRKPSKNYSDCQYLQGELKAPLDVLYPKLLIVVEYNLFKKLNKNINETIQYVSTFWNAVNSKYRKLTYPKINIAITGIIIEMDNSALRFIYNSLNITSSIQIKLAHLQSRIYLKQQSDYFEKTFRKIVNFKNYDSTFTMTGLRAISRLGQSYRGRICDHHYNVGMIIDNANFSGIPIAVREFGHLLGLTHDKIENPCENVPKDNVSTFMTSRWSNAEKFVWSDCSKREIQEFAWRKAAECLRSL